jgi:hypothetical protein
MYNKSLENAASSGNWENINISTITHEMLAKRDDKANSLSHIATKNGMLNKIPKELMTDDIWLQENKVGNSVMHLAAAKNEFHLVPKHLITEDNLLTINNRGLTIMDVLSTNMDINALPKELLSDRTLGRTDGEEGPSLQKVISAMTYAKILLLNDRLKMLERNLKTILSFLSTKNLKEHLELKPKTPEMENMSKMKFKKGIS